jgi:hypothetical protein
MSGLPAGGGLLSLVGMTVEEGSAMDAEFSDRIHGGVIRR